MDNEKIAVAFSKKFAEPYKSMSKEDISELLKDFQDGSIAQMQEYLFYQGDENVSLSDVGSASQGMAGCDFVAIKTLNGTYLLLRGEEGYQEKFEAEGYPSTNSSKNFEMTDLDSIFKAENFPVSGKGEMAKQAMKSLLSGKATKEQLDFIKNNSYQKEPFYENPELMAMIENKTEHSIDEVKEAISDRKIGDINQTVSEISKEPTQEVEQEK